MFDITFIVTNMDIKHLEKTQFLLCFTCFSLSDNSTGVVKKHLNVLSNVPIYTPCVMLKPVTIPKEETHLKATYVHMKHEKFLCMC